LFNGITPFHARNRAEFEGKVQECSYSLKDSTIPFMTIEAVSFLSQCLQ
jgi:serine/threonine protein kinase